MSSDDSRDVSLTQQVRSGVIWTILKTFSSQGARFIGSIVLARILFPEDFGIMGIVLLVTRFAEKLGNFGFTQILIQRKLIDDAHIRTTFTLNLIISGLTTAAVFTFAPAIGGFVTSAQDSGYLSKVIDILRVISVIFLIHSFYAVPNSLLKREMKFKQESLVGMVGGMVKFLSPIGFALAGWGVWSLVVGHLLGELIQVIMFYIVTRWTPKLGIHKEALKNVFSFGVWLNMYSYVQYFYKNIDYFFISKFLGYTALGFYERSYNLMNAPRKRVKDMIGAVLFSAYSRIQDEDERLNYAMRRVMSAVTLVTFPVMIWLIYVSPSIVPFLYGDKWFNSVTPLQIMSIAGLIESVTMVFYPAFLAKGLAKNRTKVHAIVLVFLIGGVYWAARYSINHVAWAVTASSAIGLFINANEYRRFSSWTWKDLWLGVKPALITGTIMAGMMGLAAYGLLFYLKEDSPIVLFALSAFAALLFFSIMAIFKFPEYNDARDMVFRRKKKLKKKVKAE